MSQSVVPEVQRMCLTGTVLFLKTIGVKDIVHFEFIDTPGEESIVRALEKLYILGALDCNGALTLTGRVMSSFPTDPQLSKMLLSSEKYRVSVEASVIAAMLSSGFMCR
jgi:HrpA-like RNA helicase